MAKQHPDDPQPRNKPPSQASQDEPEIVDADEALEADDAANAGRKKTQLAKQSPQPTQLAKKASQPTMLAPGASKAQDTPPRPPKVSDDDEAMEAEAVDSGVVEVQPVSDVVMAQPASDALEAMPASDVAEAEAVESGVAKAAPVQGQDDEDVFSAEEAEVDRKSAPETPVKAEQADLEYAESLDEDAVGGDVPTSRAESSVRVRSKKTDEFRKPGPFNKTDEFRQPFDLSGQQADDQTVSFDDVGEGSSVDLGAKPPVKSGGSGSSHHGVDEVAEALESGVNLGALDSAARRPSSNLEFDVLEGAAAADDVPSSRKNLGRERTPEDVDISGEAGAAEEVAAADLLGEDDEAAAKTTEDEAADLWNEAEVPAATESDADEAAEVEAPAAGPSTPVPTRKGKAPAAPAAEEEDAAAADEAPAPAPRKKKAGGTAVMTKPAKPSYTSWIGGGVLGLLLGVGGVVGAQFLGVLPGGDSSAKKTVTPPPPPPPQLTPVQRALEAIAQNDYDAALQLLQNAEETPANLTARAQAGWLKYQKDQADKKADLNADDKAVKDVLDDLAKANNDMLKAQVLKTLEHKSLSEQVAGLKANEKAVLELRNILAKENIKADPKDLPLALSKALATKKEAEAQLQAIQKALADAKLAGNGKLDPAAIDKIVKNLAANQAALAAVDTLLADAKIKDKGSKGVEQLVTAAKDLDAKLTAVNKVLTGEKIKGEGAAGLQEILKLRNQLQKDRDELDQAIKAAHKELADAQLVPPGGNPRQQVLVGAKAARQRTESPLTVPLAQLAATLGSLGLNPVRDTPATFANAALLAEVNFYRLREPLIQSPEQRLDSHLVIYQDRSRNDPTEHAAALRDAEWVLSKAADASATARAKAHAVIGLVRRNQEKYAAAKQALAAALATPVPSPGPWQARAKQTLSELTNPSAFYLPRIDQLQAGGQFKSAQQEIATALKAMPNDGRLLAHRALVRLEEARGAKIPANVEAAIRQDASAALKSAPAAADGAYALGLLEEELGNYDQAEKLFRQALTTHQGTRDDANRYRIALARVLQRDRAPFAAPPPAPKEDKKAADAAEGELSQAFPLALGLVLAQVGAEDELDAAAAARLKESMDLAKELLQSANPKIKAQGHMLLGQALAKQGKRTEGIREYLKGMEMLVPGMAGKEIARLIEEHPAFQQPDAAKAPSAYLAEVHFGKGLHLYWSRHFPEAEAHFKQAVGFFGHDARYQYYLGLAQYAQKSKVKRDAAFVSFEEGAKLEANNRPSVSEINASLERIQGDLRQLINSFRTKAVELPD